MVRLELNAQLEQRLSQIPAPILRQLVAILPLSCTDLMARVNCAVDENPLLDRAPGSPCPGCGRHLSNGRCGSCTGFRHLPEAVEQGNWRDELIAALRGELPAADAVMAEYVVGCLDERGFLAADVGPSVTADGDVRRSWARVLEVLRRVGPPGIGATSPTDCVRQQVAALIRDGQAPRILAVMVADYLGELAAGDVHGIATGLGVAAGQVESALGVLRRRVRPFVPLTSFQSAPKVTPDLVLVTDPTSEFGLKVIAVDSEWFGLRLDTDLLRLKSSAAVTAWMEPYRREARDLLSLLDLRGSLLRRIGGVLVERQRAFLLGRSAEHHELRRTEVAATLGVSGSTVGRAVAAKFLRCPDGRVIPMADCFGAAIGPKATLQVLLERHPNAGDGELTRLLAGEGFDLARRTVAKYRAELGAPARQARFGTPTTAKITSRQPGL